MQTIKVICHNYWLYLEKNDDILLIGGRGIIEMKIDTRKLNRELTSHIILCLPISLGSLYITKAKQNRTSKDQSYVLSLSKDIEWNLTSEIKYKKNPMIADWSAPDPDLEENVTQHLNGVYSNDFSIR